MRPDESEREESFHAARLHVREIPGTVQLRAGAGAAMRVRITGSKKLVEQIACRACGDLLHISGPTRQTRVAVIDAGAGSTRAHASVSGVSVTTVSTSVHAAGADVVTSSRVITDHGEVVRIDSDTQAVEIVVDVPVHAPITVEGAGGRYRIGDIEGRLDVRLNGIGELIAGRIATGHVDLSGASRVQIVAVDGPELRVRISGTGELTVREGHVEDLIVTVTDAGKAIFGGVATRADLSASATGSIRINQVTASLVERQEGLSRISVHGPPRRDPDSFWA